MQKDRVFILRVILGTKCMCSRTKQHNKSRLNRVRRQRLQRYEISVIMNKKQVKESISGFLRFADYPTVSAIRSVCRKRFSQTVEVLDNLSGEEWEAIKNGGLRSLDKSKLDGLRSAMERDKFEWSAG